MNGPPDAERVMHPKPWMLSLAATLIGIALLRVYMLRFEQETSGGPKTSVLALTRDLRAGTPLQRTVLTERELPEAYRESRHVPARDLDQVLGATLGIAGRAGDTLLWTDLASLREPGRTLSSLVPEGMRAITLDVRAATSDALIAPGDRVDVMQVSAHLGGADAAQAATIADNLLVLAVGTDLGDAAARSNSASGISLGVTPEQAAQLAV